MITKILHAVFGCGPHLNVIAWSIMGNPIEQCSYCHQLYVTYGSVNPTRRAISAEEAHEIADFHDDSALVEVDCQPM